MEKMDGMSMDVTAENIERLKELFPNVVTEGKIDFEKLQEVLGEDVDVSKERYQFTWPGKSQSIKIAQAPSSMTLIPCKEKSKNWESTKNMFIEGDNLEVLKQLQKTYFGKVRMIYIDPPYNTGRDFVYKDTFKETAKSYIEQTQQGGMSNPNTGGRFHSNWLNMMYPRLILARNLLSADGVIFISIDDNEVDELKMICSEVFGENNFVGCAGRITKKSNNKGEFWAPNFDYVLTYTKNREAAIEFTGGANIDSYNLIETEGPRKGEKYQLVRLYMSSIQNRNPEQRFWIDCPDGSKIIPPGTTVPPERPNLGDGIWRWSRSTFEANKERIVIKEVKRSNLLNENKEPAKWNVYTKTYLNDVLEKSSAKPNSFIEGYINQMASHELNELDIPFDYAKPTALIKYLMNVAQVKDDDIVLDFFSGSASTADAVMQMNSDDNGNRRFIMVQLPEIIDEKSEAYKAGFKTICEIGEERIRRAGNKINNNLHKKQEKEGLFISENEKFNVDLGFKVFKLETTNINPWDNKHEYDEESLFSTASVFKLDRNKEDILYEIMLKYGIFDQPVSTIEINGKSMYRVGHRHMIVCLEDNVDGKDIEEICKMGSRVVVFKEDGFKDDNAKINAEYNLKKSGVEDIKCI